MLNYLGFAIAGTLLFLAAALTIVVFGEPVFRGPVVVILLLTAAGQFIAQDGRAFVRGVSIALTYFCFLGMMLIATQAF